MMDVKHLIMYALSVSMTCTLSLSATHPLWFHCNFECLNWFWSTNSYTVLELSLVPLQIQLDKTCASE